LSPAGPQVKGTLGIAGMLVALRRLR